MESVRSWSLFLCAIGWSLYTCFPQFSANAALEVDGDLWTSQWRLATHINILQPDGTSKYVALRIPCCVDAQVFLDTYA